MIRANSFSGSICITITSGSIEHLLKKFNEAGIPVYDVQLSDMLTATVRISRRHRVQAQALTNRFGATFKITKRQGLYWPVRSLLNRPVLFAGVLLLMVLSLYLPGQVYFVEVEGNHQLPTEYILERATECGITFGANRRDIRSEKVKNQLLAAIPELEWAGINTKGCLAVIQVREKSATSETEGGKYRVSSIVASRDGIITSQTVTQGTSLCRVGQAVKTGELLVSGYTDCGLKIQATQADAEIMALTARQTMLVTPAEYCKRQEIMREETKYSMLVGKKLINFYNDSGILDTTCVKMYEQIYLTLPGGFRLPLAIRKERWVYYNTEVNQNEEIDSYAWLISYAESYLQDQMAAGEILFAETKMNFSDNAVCLQGKYSCREMIGKVKIEESVYQHG